MSEPNPRTSPRGRSVALIGLSGTGKSTIAPLLASRLGLGGSVDLDRVVESRLGGTVEEIFTREGEAAFRRAEADALAEALTGQPVVVATGGGVVLDSGNRALIRSSSTVVWLRASTAQLVARLTDTAEARPLLAGDPAFALERLAEERSALYAELADHIVDVDGLDVAQVLEEVIRGVA